MEVSQFLYSLDYMHVACDHVMMVYTKNVK